MTSVFCFFGLQLTVAVTTHPFVSTGNLNGVLDIAASYPELVIRRNSLFFKKTFEKPPTKTFLELCNEFLAPEHWERNT